MGRSAEEAPILGSVSETSAAVLSRQRRPARDVGWAVVYVLSLLLALGGAAYAGVHRNPDFARLISPDYLSDARHCPTAAGPSRRLLLADGEAEGDFTPTNLLQAVGACSSISIAGGLGLGVLALVLARRHPHACVTSAVALQVLLPASAGVAIIAAGGGTASVPLFLCAGVLAGVFWLYRTQLLLVGRLLGVAAAALVHNAAAIVGGSLLLSLAGLLASVPLGTGMLLAFANGGVVPNPEVAAIVSNATHAGGVSCVGGDQQEVLCCAWQPEGWAMGYIAYAALMLSWTVLLAFTLKVFVVSSITASWYHAPAGRAPSGGLGASLRAAFGPSFGSLCLGSWLLNLLSMLKSAVSSMRSDNLLLQMLASCAEFLISLLEAVTKFAIVRIAITGEALMPACRATSALLSRNLLDTVGVWWFPPLVLNMTALLLAGVWGGIVGVSGWAWWGGGQSALASGVGLGLLAFVLGSLALTFVNGLLLNVIDAIYILWAMERDAGGASSHPQVNAVYVLLPSNKGGVVEQPGGDYAYAAAANTPLAPQPYPSPSAGVVAPSGAYPGVPHL